MGSYGMMQEVAAVEEVVYSGSRGGGHSLGQA